MEEEPIPTDEELLSATVFTDAIREGRSQDTAEFAAIQAGKLRYYSWPERIKRWCISKLILIGGFIGSVAAAVGLVMHDSIIAHVTAWLS